MPFSKYSPKQKKLARVAKPRTKITSADFKKLRKAIIELAKKDKSPELFSKDIDRSLLARLFKSKLLDSIPPFHHRIKGSLETNLYCER